jgi:hypothetical protein
MRYIYLDQFGEDVNQLIAVLPLISDNQKTSINLLFGKSNASHYIKKQ